MTNHTPEPWSIDKYGCVTAPSVTALHRSIEVGGFALSGSQLAELNSQRIVACVNACAGIPQKWLIEHGPYAMDKWQVCLQLDAVTAQRDDLLSAMRKLACLGNGDKYGNSDGNIIAQEAIAKCEAKP